MLWNIRLWSKCKVWLIMQVSPQAVNLRDRGQSMTSEVRTIVLVIDTESNKLLQAWAC